MQINLLPQPSPVHRARNILLYSLAGALLLVNFWLLSSIVASHFEKKQQELILQDTNRQIEALQDELEERNKLELLSRRYEVLTEWSASRPLFRADVHLLSSLLPEDSYLVRVSLIERDRFELLAVLPDMESVSTYVRLLEDNPAVDSVEVQNLTRREIAETEATVEAGDDSSGGTQVSSLSLPGMLRHVWQQYLHPVLGTGVVYASDSGEEDDTEDADGAADGSGGSGGGAGSGSNNGSNNSGSQTSNGSNAQQSVTVQYELSLAVTLKRDI